MKIIGKLNDGDSVIVINRKNEKQAKTILTISKWSIHFDDDTSVSEYNRSDNGKIIIHAENPLLSELANEHKAYQVVKFISWNTSNKLKNPVLLEAISNLANLIDEDEMNDDLSKLKTLGCAKDEGEYVHGALSKLTRGEDGAY